MYQLHGYDSNIGSEILKLQDVQTLSRLIKDGECRTIAGGDVGNRFNLNAFGDLDGDGNQARFQHPLAGKILKDCIVQSETKADHCG